MAKNNSIIIGLMLFENDKERMIFIGKERRMKMTLSRLNRSVLHVNEMTPPRVELGLHPCEGYVVTARLWGLSIFRA